MISLSGPGFESLRLHSHPPKPLRGVGGFSFRLRDAALQAGPSLKMYTVHFLYARSPIRLHQTFILSSMDHFDHNLCNILLVTSKQSQGIV